MTENATFLIAAYAVVWIGVLLYVTALARRSRNIERDIEELRSLKVLTPKGSNSSAQGSALGPDV